jgi:SAM-dependent methyltransferase
MLDESKARFRDFERDGWNQVAASYARVTEGVSDQIAAPLLDVATGPGWTAAAAARRGARATGLDISSSMAEEARRRHPDITVEVAPAEEMPFADGAFDAVVSAYGMPHFFDHGAVFREAARVLVDGGRIAVASWNPPASNPFFAVALGSIAQCGSLDVELPEGVDMFTWADDDACRELFTGAGFEEPERQEVEIRIVTDDGPATVLEVLENASVRSRALYQAQTDEARVAIAARIAEMLEPMERDGRWTIPLSAFVVTAGRR